MTIKDVERLGGCEHQITADPSATKREILNNFAKNNYKETYSMIVANPKQALGPGPGFTGEELLSKDELNLILDLEDEQRRLSHFTCIFPLPGSAAKYYGCAEVKRYQNALYCAWLSTGLAAKSQLIKRCQKQYGHH